jgi:putative DNA primase/helicase
MTDVDQIWAEAFYRYQDGESLILSPEEEKIAFEEQRDAMESDDREGLIEDYLETLLPEKWDLMDLYERRKSKHSDNDCAENRTAGTPITSNAIL